MFNYSIAWIRVVEFRCLYHSVIKRDDTQSYAANGNQAAHELVQYMLDFTFRGIKAMELKVTGISLHTGSTVRHTVLAAIFVLINFSPPVQSAPSSQLQELAGFKYITLVSAGGNPAHALPMVIAMHYMGGGPHTSLEDYSELGVPARLILLAGPYRYKDGYTWFPDGESFYDRETGQQSEAILQTAGNLSHFLTAVVRRYPTAGQPVVTGYSQGGDLAYALALNYPDRISAALPMGGRLLRGFRSNMKAGREYPRIVIFHGQQDPVVPLSEAENAFRFLTDTGLDVELLTYPETGHGYPQEMKDDYQATVLSIVANHSMEGPIEN